MKTSFRSTLFTVLSSSLLLGLVACQKSEPVKEMSEPAEKPALVLETLDQRVSYGIGRNIGGNIANDPNLEVDTDALLAGLMDAVGGAESQLTDEELQAAFTEIRARAEAAAKEAAAAAAAKSIEYLATNGQRPEVTTTESGLQYEILTAGDGPKPAATDRVRVHYHGTLIDGTVFDSSVQRGTPAEFPVNGVIRGWVEALQLMPVGSKWKLHIPADIAYGERGQGSIPGGAALIFDVELLEILTAPEATATP